MALGETPGFGILDYIIFAITILISSGIGIYYAFTGGRQRTTAEFLVANRNLRVAPVALSLIVSYESSILILGNPAEVYIYGAQFWLINVGWAISALLVTQLLVPLFSNLKVLSGYEYLEHRFKSRAVRLFASFLGIIGNMFSDDTPAFAECWYMGVVLYGPATALEAVTDFPVWNSVFVVALAAIFYTTVGGIKAVIWADAFQLIVMLAGMLALIIKGTMTVGGIQNVWRIADEGGRLNFFNFAMDPTIRHTFWGLVIGGGIRGMVIGTNQTTVQRIATMPTLNKAKTIMLLSIPGFLFFGTLAILQGIIAYSYYRFIECDPLEAKLIANPNQVLPLFVMHAFDGLPGLPGLFLAALFSASLSTLSSGLNSLCTLLWTDFLKPYIRPVTEFRATLITKGLAANGVEPIVFNGYVFLARMLGTVADSPRSISPQTDSMQHVVWWSVQKLGAVRSVAVRRWNLTVISCVGVWHGERLLYSVRGCARQVILFGIISIGIALLVMNIDGPIGQISSSVSSSFGGPLIGMFLLGTLFYQATAKGALIGSIFSAALCIWMAMGSNFSPLHRKAPHLEPSSTANCFASNSTPLFMEYLSNGTSISYDAEHDQLGVTTATAPIVENPRLSGLAAFYSISYLWFGAIGVISTIVIGLAASFITGANKREDVDPAYLVPFFDRLFCCLPETVRAKLRCGINYDNIKPKKEDAVQVMAKADETMDGDIIFITDLTPSEQDPGNNPENHADKQK